MKISVIDSKSTHLVRSTVFNRPLEQCPFPLDDHNDTFHLGAFEGEKLCGIATFVQEPSIYFKDALTPYRLRGMGTLSEYRGQGMGRALILRGQDVLKELNSDALWFNARIVAFPFYEKMGFSYYSELFDIPHIGQHRVMGKKLN
jgi:GNAT superfamily N-acetyltransferase